MGGVIGLRGIAMSLRIEATYENGILKPDGPLPLAERERVIVSVETKSSRAQQSYGLIGWTGDPQVLRQIAEDDEFSNLEAP
jgi:predicted DNA-binding antitoxin AbrB/MazE fold protein